MYKLLIAITLFFISTQSIVANSIFEQFSTDILSIDGQTAIIKNSDNIVVGSSGIVTHTFESGVSTIVARADVIKKEGDKATIKFGMYRLSTQTAFPKPGILPTVGDRVTLNFLYSRALIVAPNFRVFKEVTEHFSEIEWVHPDLVAAYLTRRFRPNPDKEIFRKVCEVNSAGVIFFALSGSGYFVDCNNFTVLKEVRADQVKTAQVPFYSRVKDIDTSVFAWSGSNIEDFNGYYRALIGR